jgi:hypothetical protein
VEWWGTDYVYNLGVGFDSQPHNLGKTWFPCVDNFTDKATYDVFVTVPNSDTEAICGGNYVGIIENGDGTYTLTERQQKKLKWRCDLIKLTGTKEVNLNCDHEALFCPIDENGNKKDTEARDYTGRKNYQGKPQEWYKLIKASVQYVQS